MAVMEECAMRHKTTEAVFRYFNGLRAGRPAPLRAEIDPSALKSELPDLFILEKRRDGIVTFRLAGTRFCSILGQEMREHAFTEIWEPAVRHRMRLAADAVLANCKALEIAVTAVEEDGDTFELEMLLLPLFSSADKCDRIFGSLAAMEQGRVLYSRPRLLTPAELAFGRVRVDDASMRGPSEMTLHDARDVSVATVANRVGHLRVLQGGRRD
jgi:hypothetical protein